MSLIVIVGCGSPPPIGIVEGTNFWIEATLDVEAACEEGTPRCTITAVFDPKSREDDWYLFEVEENTCVKLKDPNGESLESGRGFDPIYLETMLSRQFTVHINPHPDSYLPTQCAIAVSVTADRLTAEMELFRIEATVVVHTHRNEEGIVVFGEDKTIPPYNRMDRMDQIDGTGNVRCAFRDDVLYLGVGAQETDAITVTLGAAVQFVSDRLPDDVGIKEESLHDVVITSAILEKITADGNKIVSLPIELADLVVETADTRCGDYPIKVGWKGQERHRLPIKLVVGGCAGSAEDVLTFWAEPDRRNVLD